jgi:hypothetical protein
MRAFEVAAFEHAERRGPGIAGAALPALNATDEAQRRATKNS